MEFVLTPNANAVPQLEPGDRLSVQFRLSERPARARYLRIYEMGFTAEAHVLDVLSDALQLGRADSIDAIIREYGVVGQWRPSTIIVEQVSPLGTNRVIGGRDVVAHAYWNADLDVALEGYDGIALWLVNDEKRARVLRPTLLCTSMADAAFYETGLAQTALNEARQLQLSVAQLSRTVGELKAAESLSNRNRTVASSSWGGGGFGDNDE